MLKFSKRPIKLTVTLDQKIFYLLGKIGNIICLSPDQVVAKILHETLTEDYNSPESHRKLEIINQKLDQLLIGQGINPQLVMKSRVRSISVNGVAADGLSSSLENDQLVSRIQRILQNEEIKNPG